MKKFVLLLLVIAIIGSTFADCSAASKPKKLPVLKVAIMPFLLSLPVKYMVDRGWDKENGFKIETILFSTGAPMNEALGAGLWDVATIGTAAVTTISVYNAKLIAETSDAAGGIELFARPDSPIAKVKGFNPTFPTLMGNPETVRGKTILMPIGTIVQLMALKWEEKIGVKDKEVNSVNMEYATAFQAFNSGQGDLVALNPPLSFMAHEKGWVSVCNLNDLKIPQYDNVLASSNAYEKKKNLLVKFVRLMYRANAELKKNPALEAKELSAWYKQNGQNVDEKLVKAEVASRPLLTAEDARKKPLGDAMKTTAEFMASIGKLQTDKLPIFDKNIVNDVLKAALRK
ncbi:NitT/TauT family transport system substrate-binding protein [Hydrogenispora ethanolica]|uniref:NitT/TauT family transport system substrate-binding protein n=1 Tax=Hydrogenispora ethanolica TaxID=1082276 RepID=A0A4V2QDA8_HYDET|nr:ABC transporter substrate-binding protein [Hydrogenispora ethanolica]TCL63347.1 NitT/TauT family transport system substrate-binding protein [Hydrogenispora ethanolica]